MEKNINQLLITLRDSAVGQWWTEHGLWVALLAPLAYVIICCIVSNSSEKRVYFYSYLDVLILFIPIITFLALSFFLGIEDNKKLSAIRELQEETGYLVTEDRLEKLCDVHVALGYSSELITIYFVDGLEHAGEQNPDDDEFINLKKYPLDEAFRLLDENIITDSKTMLALAYLKNRKGAK